jgi:dTDP-4-dehydrorhamnose reductase
MAENFIKKNNSNYIILRAAWMLGTSSNVKKFAELMVEKISADEDVSAVFDKFGSLTSARRFANIISTLIDSHKVGTFNIGSRTPCSRYDVAKEIAWRLSSKSNVEPVPSSTFKLPAPRGFSEGLDSTQAQLILGYEALKWEDELQEFMNELNIGG